MRLDLFAQVAYFFGPPCILFRMCENLLRSVFCVSCVLSLGLGSGVAVGDLGRGDSWEWSTLRTACLTLTLLID